MQIRRARAPSKTVPPSFATAIIIRSLQASQLTSKFLGILEVMQNIRVSDTAASRPLTLTMEQAKSFGVRHNRRDQVDWHEKRSVHR